MATSNTIPDPRLVNPLVCGPESPLSRFPRDTLRNVAHTLGLYAVFIGDRTGDVDPFELEDYRYAFLLQLEGMRNVLLALSDTLVLHKPALNPGEVPVQLEPDELSKLEILAGRGGSSVADAARGIVSDWLRTFRPDKEGVK